MPATLNVVPASVAVGIAMIATNTISATRASAVAGIGKADAKGDDQDQRPPRAKAAGRRRIASGDEKSTTSSGLWTAGKEGYRAARERGDGGGEARERLLAPAAGADEQCRGAERRVDRLRVDEWCVDVGRPHVRQARERALREAEAREEGREEAG